MRIEREQFDEAEARISLADRHRRPARVRRMDHGGDDPADRLGRHPGSGCRRRRQGPRLPRIGPLRDDRDLEAVRHPVLPPLLPDGGRGSLRRGRRQAHGASLSRGFVASGRRNRHAVLAVRDPAPPRPSRTPPGRKGGEAPGQPSCWPGASRPPCSSCGRRWTSPISTLGTSTRSIVRWVTSGATPPTRRWPWPRRSSAALRETGPAARGHPRRGHGRAGGCLETERAGLGGALRTDHGLPAGVAARRKGGQQPRSERAHRGARPACVVGWYENAFRLLRECYDELDRRATRPDAPVKTMAEAMFPSSRIGLVRAFRRHVAALGGGAARQRPATGRPGSRWPRADAGRPGDPGVGPHRSLLRLVPRRRRGRRPLVGPGLRRRRAGGDGGRRRRGGPGGRPGRWRSRRWRRCSGRHPASDPVRRGPGHRRHPGDRR